MAKSKWIPYKWNWDSKRKVWKFPYYKHGDKKRQYAERSGTKGKKPSGIPDIKGMDLGHPEAIKRGIGGSKLREEKKRLEKQPISMKEAQKVMDERTPMAVETDRSKTSENTYDKPNKWWKKYPTKSDVDGIDDKIY